MSRQLPHGQEVSDMEVLDVRSNRSGKKEYLVDISLKSMLQHTANLGNRKDSGSRNFTAWIPDELLEKSLKSAREMAVKKKPSGPKTTVEQNTPEKLRASTKEPTTPRKEHVPHVPRKEQVKSENMSSRAGRSKSKERSNSRGKDKQVRFRLEEIETRNQHQGVVTRSRAKAEKTQLKALNY